jgi:tetratricopeptide (TPR) repeat protein
MSLVRGYHARFARGQRRAAVPLALSLLIVLITAAPGAARAAEAADDDGGKAAAAAHLKQGIELRKKGELAPAEDELNLAIAAFPSAGLLYSERGQLRYLRRNYRGAVEDFSVYLTQMPNDAKILLLRSQARRFATPEDKSGACADFAALRRMDASLGHIEGMDRYCR